MVVFKKCRFYQNFNNIYINGFSFFFKCVYLYQPKKHGLIVTSLTEDFCCLDIENDYNK